MCVPQVQPLGVTLHLWSVALEGDKRKRSKGEERREEAGGWRYHSVGAA